MDLRSVSGKEKKNKQIYLPDFHNAFCLLSNEHFLSPLRLWPKNDKSSGDVHHSTERLIQ